LNLRVYTPQGHLYQEIPIAFLGDEVTRAATGRAGGKKRAPLAVRLPVGGTSIANASLYGEWKVVPHLDGNPKPCGAATAFTIVP
jgi:hypothetical protein